jgi:hypothetical protein
MDPQYVKFYGQENNEIVEREWYERAEESILPWLDEAEIGSREYGEDDPWLEEG